MSSSGTPAIVREALAHRLARHLPPTLKEALKTLRQPGHGFEVLRRDVAARFGAYHYAHHILFVAGAPKSGTTWVENFLFQIPGYCPRQLAGDPAVIANHDLPDDAFRHARPDGYSYYKTHVTATNRNLAIIERAGVRKIVVMYRDPRDIAVSRYFHLTSGQDDHVPGDGLRYSDLTKSQGLAASIEVVLSTYVDWIQQWRARVSCDPTRYLVITYEQLKQDPGGQLTALLDFYGLRFPPETVAEMMARANWVAGGQLKLGGMPGTRSTFRKGIIGDWRNHFTDEHRQRFREAAGDFLIECGYETDRDW